MDITAVVELRDLVYFLAVAEELHFTRAARRLGIAQPRLSREIRNLERRLGTELFQRTRRSVALTEAGRGFLDDARDTLRQAEESVARARQAGEGLRGRIRIGLCLGAIFSIVPAHLRAFRAQFPNVSIVLREIPTRLQIEALENQQIDVGYVRPATAAGIEVSEVHRDRYLVALPRTHRLAEAREIGLERLSGEQMILFSRSIAPALYDLTMTLLREAGVPPSQVQEAEQLSTVLGLVAGGAGLSLLPSATGVLGGGEVVFRPFAGFDRELSLSLAWRTDERSQIINAYVATARQFSPGETLAD